MALRRLQRMKSRVIRLNFLSQYIFKKGFQGVATSGYEFLIFVIFLEDLQNLSKIVRFLKFKKNPRSLLPLEKLRFLKI